MADLNVSGLDQVLKTLETLFSTVLSDMTLELNSRDRVRFVMHSSQLNSPISLPFMPKEHLTARRILFEVERVFQSYQQFVLRHDIHLNIIRVKLPARSGPKRDRGPLICKEDWKRKDLFFA